MASPSCAASRTSIAARSCAPKQCGGAATAASSPITCWRPARRSSTSWPWESSIPPGSAPPRNRSRTVRSSTPAKSRDRCSEGPLRLAALATSPALRGRIKCRCNSPHPGGGGPCEAWWRGHRGAPDCNPPSTRRRLRRLHRGQGLDLLVPGSELRVAVAPTVTGEAEVEITEGAAGGDRADRARPGQVLAFERRQSLVRLAHLP